MRDNTQQLRTILRNCEMKTLQFDPAQHARDLAARRAKNKSAGEAALRPPLLCSPEWGTPPVSIFVRAPQYGRSLLGESGTRTVLRLPQRGEKKPA